MVAGGLPATVAGCCTPGAQQLAHAVRLKRATIEGRTVVAATYLLYCRANTNTNTNTKEM